MTDQAPDAARWQGYSHKELYRLLHEGTGPAASAEPSRRWAEVSSTLSEVGQDLKQAIGLSGSGWTGPAAGAAYDRLAGLVDWAGQTGTSAAEMRQSVENQAEYLAKARADMPTPEDVPPPQPDPTVAPAVQVLATNTDGERVDAAASTGEQRAFEVMATYQLNTDTNTGALADFTAPAELVGSNDVRSNQGAGVGVTTSSAAAGIAVPAAREHDHDGRGHRHGEQGRWGGHGTPTSGAAAADPEVIRRPLPGPGGFSGAAPINGPLHGTGPIGRPDGGQQGGARTGGSGGQRGGLPTAGPTSGPGMGHTTGTPTADMQSAAAGQAAAAAAGHSPGATGAGAGAGYAGGSQDKAAMRRFGVDAIGSGQWFGDADEDGSARGASPTRRRRDFRESERVTESVSVDGEEHHLPPNVIGDGPR